MGESETRRLSEIIEAGSTSGWHSFEQSLLKAFEKGYVSEETALLYCVNKPTMRQRIDAAKKMGNSPEYASLKMREEEKPAPKPRPMPPPAPAPTMAPAPGAPQTGAPKPTMPAMPTMPGMPAAPKPTAA
jgi:hypothetical protein